MPQRPKILEALGYRVTALARIVVKKAREAPIVGKAIGYVEDTVSPWLEPAIAHVEKDGLYLLSLVDNKVINRGLPSNFCGAGCLPISCIHSYLPFELLPWS